MENKKPWEIYPVKEEVVQQPPVNLLQAELAQRTSALQEDDRLSSRIAEEIAVLQEIKDAVDQRRRAHNERISAIQSQLSPRPKL